jgi:hypothetical protein
VAKLSHFVGDADLAEGRPLQRKGDDPRLNLGRGPVRQNRLLAGDFLQGKLAALLIKLLEPEKLSRL